MSNYGEYMKSLAKKNDDFFFGTDNKKKVSNKYFSFKHVLDDENIIINTNNVKFIKGTPVLVVGNKNCVYLKDWQLKEVHNYDDCCSDFYLVKLNKKYFKIYNFQNDFYDISIDGVHDFDFYMQVAKSQDELGMTVANGFMG